MFSKKLPQEFVLLRNYASRHGVVETFLKIIETLTLSLKSKNDLEYLNNYQIEVLEKEIQNVKKNIFDLPFNANVFNQPLFSTPNDVVTVQLQNISNTISEHNLNINKLRVLTKVGKRLRDDEILVLNSSKKFLGYPAINLKNKNFFISRSSQAKLLFLICCSDNVNSVTLMNSRFCKYFYKKYGALLSEIQGPMFISTDF